MMLKPEFKARHRELHQSVPWSWKLLHLGRALEHVGRYVYDALARTDTPVNIYLYMYMRVFTYIYIYIIYLFIFIFIFIHIHIHIQHTI